MLLGLRRLAHLAEHLRGRRLVEADRVVLHAADDAHRLEHAQHAEPGDLRGELGLLERELDEGHRAEVVDLVRLHLLHHRDERREVAEVAVDQLDARVLVEHQLRLRVRLAPDQPEDLVALLAEQLAEVPAVLPGDAGDERALHAEPLEVGWIEITPRPSTHPRDRAGTGTRRTGPPRPSRRSRPRTCAGPFSARRNPRLVSCSHRT